MKTSVLLLMFNRPQKALRVLRQIRQAQPENLFLACDGPRTTVPNDIGLCQETREKVEGAIDWPCRVEKLYQEDNLGCRQAVSGALDWFFQHVEEGIILEDDCVPDPGFFSYCEQLLEYYRGDSRIMAISGESYGNPENWAAGTSYSFSGYTLFWGWATWRRAWALYEPAFPYWDRAKHSGWLRDYLPSKASFLYWTKNMGYAMSGKVDSWGYPWMYSNWINNGLTIVPRTNMISNIGCGGLATHTDEEAWSMGHRAASPIDLPLKHPNSVFRNYHLEKELDLERFQISPALLNLQASGRFEMAIPRNSHLQAIRWFKKRILRQEL